MAEANPPSTKDLLLLITGLYKQEAPPTTSDQGEDYWLKDPLKTEERTLRDIRLNAGDWLTSPKDEWNKVRYRDWLIAELIQNICDHKQEFTAIPEPNVCSMDILSKEFKPGMPGVTDDIRQILTTPDTKLERSLFSALSVGLSKNKIDGKDVFTFGAGMRRRARVWLNSEEALQADVEFFVPFSVLRNSDHSEQAEFPNARSICAGILITKHNGNPIGSHDKKELYAIRFNFRIPFTIHWRSKTQEALEDLFTDFQTPEIKIHKRVDRTSNWVKFDGWKEFLESYCKLSEVSDLLNAPIGPLLLETVSSKSQLSDILLQKVDRDQIKTDLKEVQDEINDQLELLKSVYEWKPPERDRLSPNPSQRKLGGLLESLGFMSSSVGGKGEFEYTFKIASGVTIWTVLDAIFNELDGFPLYVKGVESRKDKSARIAVALASQAHPSDSKKQYFGLVAMAYNIPLTPAAKKPTVKKEPEKKNEGSKDPDVKTPTITLSDDNFTDDESILIHEEDEEEEFEGPPETPVPKPETESKPTETKPSTVEVLLHLGKWFSGESLDDNWFRRLLPKPTSGGKPRVPLPGIRFLPVKRFQGERRDAGFTWTIVIDLLSVGIDIKGTTKEGLTFLQGVAGHFGLGAIEIRLALKFSLEDIKNEKSFFDRVAIGVGVKLKDLRLSFAAPEEDGKKKKTGNEIVDGLQNVLGGDWVGIAVPEKGPERTVKTRLTAKKKDTFSISVGYLTPLKEGSHGTLDIQLYDDKGTRGKMVVIPIDRSDGAVYLRQIGIALKGVENLELSKGLPDSAQMTVAITGGLRLQVFELGFIGAKVSFPLNNPFNIQVALDGLDVSIKIGEVIVSGSFFKAGIEYAGSLTVDVPKASFSAMGFYGPLRVFYISREQEILTQLNLGNVPKKLRDKLVENNITPASVTPTGVLGGLWELVASDNTRYSITDDDDKLNVLSQEKTFFAYAMLNAASGCGPTLGPIQFTGIALGGGYNRRLKVPRIEDVAEFPLVQMVMGEGGFQSKDTSYQVLNQLGKALEDPISTLDKMKKHLVPEHGQQFLCGGARFNISGLIDCFALLIVQWGGGEIEIALLGLARFRHTRDATARPICYVEMQILMSVKPSEGTFKLQALLTNNSWIFNTDCKLTGGLALFVWFGGEHKGDWVFTLGGYHPRFKRPEHYPIVPRLGLNWPVTNELTIKGGMYLAITPSCLMVGARLEATFHSGRISAWFTAYLDVVVNWHPPYFEAELGVSLRIEAAFFLTSIKVTISASIHMWGPPVGGIAHVKLPLLQFDVEFGEPRPKEPELIKTWQQFCHDFLNMSGADRLAINNPVPAFPMVQPNLSAGRNSLDKLSTGKRTQQEVKPEDTIWKVRADQLELAASAVVPVHTLNIGTVKTGSPPEGVQERKPLVGVQDRNMSGQSVMVARPLELESLKPKKSKSTVGVHPMGKTLKSVLNVTVVRDDNLGTHPVELSEWIFEEEIGSLAAALWDPAKPNLRPSEPSAKLIGNCITGIKRLQPPSGKLGKAAPLTELAWRPLDVATVKRLEGVQPSPSATRSRNVQSEVAAKQAEQKTIADALFGAGFNLAWQPQPQVRFRELQADPLAGSVASFTR